MSEAGERGGKLLELARLRRQVLDLERELGLTAPPSPSPDAGLPETSVVDLFHLLDQHAGDFFSIHAANGDYVYASPSVTHSYGWQPAELLRTSAYGYFHEDDLARIASSHASHSDGGGAVDRVRYRLRCASGDYRWVETVSRSRQRDGEVEHIVCVTRDVHEEQSARERATGAEDELIRIHHERFARLLVNSLTHELSNPLTVAMGASQLSRTGDTEALDQIDGALERIHNVLRELRMLASMTAEVGEMELGAVIRRVVALVFDDPAPTLELDEIRIAAPRARVYHLLYSMMILHQDDTDLTIRCASTDGEASVEMKSRTGQLEERVRADVLAAVRGTQRDPVTGLRLAQAICEHDLGGTWEAQMDGGTLRTAARFRGQ